ncbi:MAG: ribose 5-phosphate isomerase B [Proteobacteria bacterium]|nr:ribose 5-phosphate isomerase B [Pseudomonadota bacterium]
MDAIADHSIVIASDHAGFELKETLKQELEALGFAVNDLGTHGGESVDYPDYADALARAVAAGEAGRGVLLCGTGIGASIAANRHAGVRAALCHDAQSASMSRRHNDANVLVLGGRVTAPETARECLRIFLDTPFEGGRHARRVAKLA